MLRIHQIASASAAQKYYSHGGDYYGQELVGDWGGKGAALLGLRGQVDQRAFSQLCQNRHPADGKRVTAHTKGERTPGYDFNWNAPKGVSLLYGATADPAILDAFRAAVQETMADIEVDMKTRVRKGRRNEERQVGNLVSAEFVHFTARPIDRVPDPALHAHIVVFNTVHDRVEHAWKAGYFRDIKRDAPYFEGLFHNRLAGKMQELGFAVERRGRFWDVSGIPQAMVQKFSRRTQQIERLAEQLGIADPDAKAKLGATSRENKAQHLDGEQLRQSWMSRMSERELAALNETIAKQPPVKPPERDSAEQAMRQSVLHSFERQSVVAYRELLGQALRNGPGQVTLDGVKRAGKRLGLILKNIDGRMMATIPEAIHEERRIIGFGKHTRGTRPRLGKRGRAMNRAWLTDGQKAAVKHALNSTDQIILIEGRAGVGKTTLTEELVEGIEENGRTAVMVAPSAQSSRGTLREAGFKGADTLQRLLIDPVMQEAARDNVIIVDEAGLVGGPTMRRLFDLVEQQNSRLILIGDRNQHHAVERGSPFELLAEKAGLPVARVDDIRRQKDAYLEAVKMLSDRRAGAGFDRLNRLGWIQEAPLAELYDKAARAYLSAFEKCRGDVLAVSPTHAEIDRFTAAIRKKLMAAGKLGEGREFKVWRPAHLTEAERGDPHSYEPGMMVQFHKAGPGFRAGARMVIDQTDAIPTSLAERFSAYRPGQLTLAVGDRLRLTANGKSLDGHRLNNGAVYGVAGFTAKGDIRLDNGWIVGREWGHFTHGWVQTSHSAQSRTVRRAVVVQSSVSLPATTAQQMYVSASRAREQTLFFTDSKAHLRDAIQREEHCMSATDLARIKRPSLRQQILERIGFVRRLASLERRSTPVRLPEKELAYERA